MVGIKFFPNIVLPLSILLQNYAILSFTLQSDNVANLVIHERIQFKNVKYEMTLFASNFDICLLRF